MSEEPDLDLIEKLVGRLGDANEDEAISALRALRRVLVRSGIQAHQLRVAFGDREVVGRSAEAARRAWETLQKATKPVTIKDAEKEAARARERCEKTAAKLRDARRTASNLRRQLKRMKDRGGDVPRSSELEAAE